ncbi:PASTA domain-containing protein [Vallitalea maricola]|uniref:Uncharacterized protein n=1 Tax=Vallitalea maricola TaxID=3074433 RepID=A0ACB5UH20_9FIRM|nr:hypothetical protein AN2V17_11300 [Vallitalea sp. AN17-2]
MDSNKNKDIFKDGFNFNLDEEKELETNEEVHNNNEIENESKIENNIIEEDNSVKDDNHKKDFLANLNETRNASFQQEEFTYQKTSNYKKWIVQIIILVIAVISIYLIVNRKTELIDFSNMLYEDAAAWANDKNIILTYEEEYSNEIQDDYIISQSIEPGEKVGKDSTVKLSISKGKDPYEKIAVPDFDTSWSKTSIENWIEQNGIINYKFNNIESEEIPSNYLISYELIGATDETFVRSSEIEFAISYTETFDTVVVPDFINKTMIDVDIWAKNNNMEYTYSYEKSSLYDEDIIINQSVKSGEEMDVNEVFSFVISTGDENETIIMENFLNRTIIDADIWAKNNRIRYTYSYEYSDIYPEDSISYQSIKADEEIKEGDTVRFIISKGTEEEEEEIIVMDNFLNRALLDVDIWAKSNGIDYNYTYEYNSIYEKDKIMYQSIPDGDELLGDEVLNFIVSKGEEIVVPDFSELTVAEAKEYDDNSIDVKIIEKYVKDTREGEFLSQSIRAEEVVEEGMEMRAEYSLGDRITVPSFINELKQDIEEWIEEANDNGANLDLIVNEQAGTGLEYGKIISQNIYNDDIDLSSDIEITISSGLTVPSFVNMSKSEVSNYSQTSDLNVEVVEIYQQGTSAGKFISQSIETGTKVNKGTYVTVYYSLGDTINIPKFVNRSVTELQEWVDEQNNKGAQLTITKTELHINDLDYGLIFSQNIYNQSNAELDTNIEVVVSLGELYSVINFSEYSVSEIEDIAEENDLTIIFETVKDSSYSSGKVISQEPESGELISKKDFIKIRIAE